MIMFEFVTSFLPWPFRCQGTGDEETGGDGLISSCKLESSIFCERGIGMDLVSLSIKLDKGGPVFF